MVFNSLNFLLFLPLVVLVYYVMPKRVRHVWLLVASYYFYMCWNAKYALLILVSTVVTYISGILLDKVNKIEDSSRNIMLKKRAIVAVSFSVSLGILFYYKYCNFAIDIIVRIFSRLHIMVTVPAFDILLPVGISFYTFQALSYTMDVYREEIEAEKDFLKYALFVSFFPQLVAGPIERSKNLISQLKKPEEFSFTNAFDGVLLILWGFFLKVVMADRIALFVDTVYGNTEQYQGMYFIVATVLFAVQIYCDFAGYSTIAVGTAKMFGINLMENFDAPYLATTVSDFWRRWHISLTSWFKDYLYIPLGGSRRGTVRKYINKIIVFLVSGLWHGANLTFIVWGAINGIYQVIGEMFMPIRIKIASLLGINKDSEGYKIVSTLFTFVLIDVAWIFFRADSLASAKYIISSIWHTENLWVLFDGSLFQCGLDDKNFRLMICTIFILFIADLLKRKGIKIREIIMRQDKWFKCIVILFSVLFILVFGKYGPKYEAANFIYFQF